ncbi:MAG: hydroxymethylbilane synthase [Verrucomicrobiales bacterium]|nr:hydroxymethylbilane synthase [Verrucomicrobiales bacterium]
MTPLNRPVVLATRGSALALAQSNMVLAQCRAAFPKLSFELRIFKTSGDKLQTAPPDLPLLPGTKGLFTKELELALLNGDADLAVHSLKDLPTDMPAGLKLGAVSKRADVRDVLIYRDAEFFAHRAASREVKRGLPALATLRDFPAGATMATSSTRRQAQLLALRPDLKCVPIRGNVGTRLQKLADQAALDGLVLAAAGLQRLGFLVLPNGQIQGDGLPAGLLGVFLEPAEMLPCVGQAALGIEARADDAQIAGICAALDDYETHQCVTAERAFLQAMGGGCLSPVAAYGDVCEGRLRLRAVSFRETEARRGEFNDDLENAVILGERLAEKLK